MSFNYKNPLTPLTSLGNLSVQRQNVFGTNFSILSTGGFMEVYNLNELYYTIPSGTTGLIEYSGNTIPIQLNKGTGSPFSFDVLTLNSDNISSGRRRLGMLVYVIDQDEVYQYQIPNFINLWNSATGATGPGGPTVIFSDFGTTIKSNTPQGISFISAWTANTIEGISGETSTTAVWKKFIVPTSGVTAVGDYLPLSGGTVTGNTTFTIGVTANTFSASTYLGLPGDIFITGGTFDNNTDTLTLDRSSGSSITITGFTDYFTTGATLIGDTIYFDRNDTLSAYTVNLSSFTPSVDVYVTGGTYSAGTTTFTNNTGGTFDVSGFTTPFTGNTSGNCITDLFVSNINSCSPLHIQPINLGDVYIGENGGVNVGIGTSTPTANLNIKTSGTTSLLKLESYSYPYSIGEINYIGTGVALGGGSSYNVTGGFYSRGISVGYQSTTNTVEAGLAIGNYVNVTSSDSAIGFGNYITSSGIFSAAFGNLASATNTNSIMIGNGARFTGFFPIVNNVPNTIALGLNSDTPTMWVTGGNGVAGSMGNVGIRTSTPTRVLDSRGTFNLEPNANTFLRFDGTLMEAQVGSSNNQLTLNRDNSGITDLKGSGSVIISNPTYSNSLSIGSNTILRENDKIVFSRSDNFVQGWWDTINNRFRIGGGGYSPIYTSTTETFEVVGTSKITSNVGIGITGSTDADTRLKIVGSDSSSSNFGLKIQDSGGTNNFVVRNDGNVGIGTSTPTAKLQIKFNDLSTGNTVSPFSVVDAFGQNIFYLSNQNYYGNPNRIGFYSYIYDNQFSIDLAGSAGQFKLTRGVNKFWMRPYPNALDINLLVESSIGGGGGSEAGIRHVFTGTSTYGTIYGESLYVGTDSSTGSTTIVGKFIGKQGFSNPNATFYPLIALDGNVGIGTSSPSEKLEVVGKTKTTNFQITSGATNGYILTSDSLGNASWSPLSGTSGYSDTYITGGTYSAGTATFTNNTGGTFNVTGFSDFHYYISGSSPSGVTLSIGDRWYNTNNGAEYVWNYDGNTYQWVQPAGTPGPQGIQGPQGVPGYSNLMVTTGITVSAETLTTDYTYYGINHIDIVNLTLPNPTGIDGFNLSIKDESGNSGIYRIRLTSPVGNIDNENYVDMNINKMSLHLVARNNNWWII